MPVARFSCTTERKNQLFIVSLKGYCDEEGGCALKKLISEVSWTDLKGVVFDFSNCLHANSSGISFLVDVAISLGDEKALDLAFCGLSPLLGEAFRMVGLTRIARVFATQEDAIRGLNE